MLRRSLSRCCESNKIDVEHAAFWETSTVSVAAGALLGTAIGHLLLKSIEQLGVGRKLSGL
jgi:hypothetical protein